MDVILDSMDFIFHTYSGEGPTPKFFPYHIWKAYDLINNEGPIGRKALSQALGIGEGSTRTIIDKMIKNGSINNTQRGVVLTEHGVKQFQNSGIVVTPIRLKEITVSDLDCAVLVKGMASHVSTGYEQMNEAVRAGASGATSLVFNKWKTYFPGRNDRTGPGKIIPFIFGFQH